MLRQLQDMGVAEEAARVALSSCAWDLQKATEQLFNWSRWHSLVSLLRYKLIIDHLIFQQTGSLGQRRIELCPDPNPNSVIRISLLVILLITVRSAFSSWPKCIKSDHDQHCIYSWEETITSLRSNTSQSIVINKKENKRTADHTEILFQKGTITNNGVSW